MTPLDRIAALRGALERIAADESPCDYASFLSDDARRALHADDLAASAPLPDLPLAEGSEMVEFRGRPAVRDVTGSLFFLSAKAPYLVESNQAQFLPDLLDVLALARRGGHV